MHEVNVTLSYAVLINLGLAANRTGYYQYLLRWAARTGEDEETDGMISRGIRDIRVPLGSFTVQNPSRLHALVTHDGVLFKARERTLFLRTQASPKALGQGLMRLMEPPECRYQFCRDSHDLAAGQPTRTLSKFIGRSVARKQSPPRHRRNVLWSPFVRAHILNSPEKLCYRVKS